MRQVYKSKKKKVEIIEKKNGMVIREELGGGGMGEAGQGQKPSVIT